MKKIFITLLFSGLVIGFTLNIAEARTVSVHGGYRSNGTYVPSHYRTGPDSSRSNNWSARGNYNPYTGKKGYSNPYK